ncbi:MAG TPA: hypothetical protein VFZ67_03625 [Nitrososphaera sp.]
MNTSKREDVTRLKSSSNRIVIAVAVVITAIILIVGGSTMVPVIAQSVLATQSSYQSGEIDEEEWGLGAEINQFTNNLIDSIFEDNGLKDNDEYGELSVNEQQFNIDSEAGGTHVIIRSSSNSGEDGEEGELNSSLSTFVHNFQHRTFADDVASGESDEDNFSAFVEDVITDSVDEGIANMSPFLW